MIILKISVVGSGYVGLVTGVCLAEVGHLVNCIDVDLKRIEMLNTGTSPIYEPGLDDLMKKNLANGRLKFTSSYKEGLENVELVFICVGTPQNEDGTANLSFIESAAKGIAKNITNDVIVVTKSTVPVGTNDFIKRLLLDNLPVPTITIDIASNPEFLREGSAVYNTFHADRIVIGTNNERVALVLESVYRPFGLKIFKTTIRNAEIIKYSSNAFLATKISFMNEISKICEQFNANIEDVAQGMGMDHRIGPHYLKAGIGYGGSCFPKDVNALIQLAGNMDHDFELLRAVINVNNRQRKLLVSKARDRLGELSGKRAAILGLSFKPNTDDVREAASITVIEELLKEGAQVVAYDPKANNHAKKVLPQNVIYADSVEEALKNADVAFILTEWHEFKLLDFEKVACLMKEPLIFDGRNCFPLEYIRQFDIEYHSIGRPPMGI